MIAAVGGERNELRNDFYTVYHVAQEAGSGGSLSYKEYYQQAFFHEDEHIKRRKKFLIL